MPTAPGRRLRGAVLLLACAALPFVPLFAGEETRPDPVPLRRVLIAPERVPAEMERAGHKRLVQMTRDEFEALVQRAARAGEAAGVKQPRLVEARYLRARLAQDALVGGGEWKVVHPGDGPAVLPLPGLNLALRRARLGDRDAVLGELDGKSLGLLLENGGEHAVALEWSARGEPKPDELDFDLELPPAPVALLELELPRDRDVTVSSDGCVLSGPLPAEAADYARWRISFAGRSRVHLTVRRAAGADQPPLVLASLQAVQELTPDGVEAEYRFSIRALHQGVQELRCEYDPALRPYDVTAPGLETWKPSEPAPGGAGPGVLEVRLREPLQGGTLQVRCRAPLAEAAGTARWTSPGLWLAGAVPRGETLELHVHRDVQLADWQPGGFRLTGT